jgi:hypothetical protein
VRLFVTSPDENTPSPLAVIVDQMSTLLAARLVQNIKQMISGVESGAAKGEQLALIEEASASSPWVALLANMLPKRLRNQLMKNPQMLGALARMGGGNHNATGAEVAPRRHHD